MNLLLSDPAFLSVAATISGGGGYDPDAQAYITAVEAADGQALETAVKDAINVFVVGCKADGIWNAIKASCILAGARTLNGALVPLKGTAPTNNNFVSGDYDRKTGLVGNGSTKYLGSNRSLNADPQDSIHITAYATVYPAVTTYMMGAGAASSGAVAMGYFGSSFARCRSSTADLFGSNTAGFIGVSRSTSTNYDLRVGQSTASFARASETSPALNHSIFGTDTNTGSRFTGRLSFYSIGESLDLALLDTRVSTLMTDIGAAIP